jgi:hypothetical protein
MEQHASTTESDAGGSHGAWFTTLRLGIAMATIGLVAALALVLVPGGTGPSDTLAVADLSGAGLPVDSAHGPAVTLANDLPDGDRYVSANPFASLRTSDGGGANASFGFGRLTADDHGPALGWITCRPLTLYVPLGGGFIPVETGYEVCTLFSNSYAGSTTFVRQVGEQS